MQQCLEYQYQYYVNGPYIKNAHKYYAQVPGEIALIGLPWVDFVVWTAAKSQTKFSSRKLISTNNI